MAAIAATLHSLFIALQVNAGELMVADRRVNPEEDSDAQEPGRMIQDLFEDLGWLQDGMRGVAALLAIYFVLKFVWDKRKGQGGGGQQVGQMALAFFLLVFFVAPDFIAVVADVIINTAVGVGDWFVELF